MLVLFFGEALAFRLLFFWQTRAYALFLNLLIRVDIAHARYTNVNQYKSMIELLFNPITYCTLLIAFLLYMFACMIFGKPKEHSAEKTDSFIKSGVEVIFAFLPFFIYGIANLLKGTLLVFLSSPELPMASMLITGLVLFSSVKAAAKNPHATSKLMVTILLALIIYSMLGCYIAWLTFSSSVNPWFSVLNCIITCFSVFVASVFLGSTNYMAEREKAG